LAALLLLAVQHLLYRLAWLAWWAAAPECHLIAVQPRQQQSAADQFYECRGY
jgi:hypothetical protein